MKQANIGAWPNLQPVTARRMGLASAAVAICAVCAPMASYPAANAAPPTSPPPAEEQAAEPNIGAERKAALMRLAELLEAMYVFPDKGVDYAAFLRSRELTEGEAQLDGTAFAQLMTKELRAVHPDAHIRVELAPQGPRGGGPGGPGGGPGGQPPASLEKVACPSDDVSYIKLNAMWGDPGTMEQVAQFIERSAGRKAIIMDMRDNRGGGLAEMDLLFSEMFAAPQDLLVMELRRTVYENDGAPFGEGPTLKRIGSPEASVRMMHRVIPADQPRLTDTEVYLLTSPTTASAAEHLALSLKRTQRATIIGSATKGAAHFGGLIPIGGGFMAFVPAGRTYDPDTGQSWEGTGVAPDIEVEPAEALARAFAEIGLDPMTEL